MPAYDQVWIIELDLAAEGQDFYALVHVVELPCCLHRFVMATMRAVAPILKLSTGPFEVTSGASARC